MTRKSLNKRLRTVYVALLVILVVALFSKMVRHIPGLASSPVEVFATDIYDFFRDMALVFITVAAAYLANVFQKRSTFTESLRHEWRAIVRTKSDLLAYCDKAYPTTEDYLGTFRSISEAIDNMRIVYRNVGETDRLIGLYPYAPLHDMRRVLTTLDPRKSGKVTPEDRTLARDAVNQLFYALRENFLDELDLEEPTWPMTAAVARRLKSSGATRSAKSYQGREIKLYEATASPRPDIDTLLSDLYYREKAADHNREQTAAAMQADRSEADGASDGTATAPEPNGAASVAKKTAPPRRG